MKPILFDAMSIKFEQSRRFIHRENICFYFNMVFGYFEVENPFKIYLK